MTECTKDKIFLTISNCKDGIEMAINYNPSVSPTAVPAPAADAAPSPAAEESIVILVSVYFTQEELKPTRRFLSNTDLLTLLNKTEKYKAFKEVYNELKSMPELSMGNNGIQLYKTNLETLNKLGNNSYDNKLIPASKATGGSQRNRQRNRKGGKSNKRENKRSRRFTRNNRE